MFKPKLPLRVFAAAIAQSVCQANEMLEQDHKLAVQRYYDDQLCELLPPPPPLMIQHVKVKFSGNVSKSDQRKEAGEVCIDLTKPDGNFSAEIELTPCSEEILHAMDKAPCAVFTGESNPAVPIVTETPMHIAQACTDVV